MRRGDGIGYTLCPKGGEPRAPAMRYLQLYEPLIDFASRKSEGFSPCRCPFHDDRTPSAGVDLDSGVFNCYVCGSFSPERFVSKILGIPMTEASKMVDAYRRENSLYNHEENWSKASAPGPSDQMESIYAEGDADLSAHPIAVDYAESRGLRVSVLEKAGVRVLPPNATHLGRECLAFPYTSMGRIVALRYRDASGNKSGTPGSRFTLWGLDDLEEGDTVVVVEGESDRLRAIQAFADSQAPFCRSVKVVSTPGAAFKREWEREFHGIPRVIVVPDADEAGESMATKAKAILGDRAKILHLPWKRGQVGKDLCDWLACNEEELFIRHAESLARTVGFGRVLSGEEFEASANRPRRMIVENLLARNQIAVMAGPPKNMKTMLLLDLFRCILSGEPFMGWPEFACPVRNARTLLIEEEGDVEELYSRVTRALSPVPDWKQRTFWAHRTGIKLDTDEGFESLCSMVDRCSPDVIAIDPFQRIHTEDENSASEMGTVWTNLHRILAMFPDISVILLHHFTKSGEIGDGWNALRGSSRTAAEADLGLFVEKRSKKDGAGIRLRIDGRTVKSLTSPDGTDVFKLAFDESTGSFSLDSGSVMMDRKDALMEELDERRTWDLKEAAIFFGVSTRTVRNWVSRCPALTVDEGVIRFAEKDPFE